MFCQQCGKKNADTARFCFACGQRIEVPEPAPNQHDSTSGQAQGLEEDEGGIRPAPGWEWVNPDDPDDVSVRLKVGYVLGDDGCSIEPADGWAWVDPDDAQNFEIRQEPRAGEDRHLAAMQSLIDAEPDSTLAAVYAAEDADLAEWGGESLIVLELLMDYSQALSPESLDVLPTAALRWTVLSERLRDPISLVEYKALLAASLYAKVLTLDVNKAELFTAVDSALDACRAAGSLSAFELDRVVSKRRAGPVSIQNIVWPWVIASWTDLEAQRASAQASLDGRKILLMISHSATLLQGPRTPLLPTGNWMRYRARRDLSLILCPAAALLAIASVWNDVPEGRGMLFALLWEINRFYSNPSRVTRGSDAQAINKALSMLSKQELTDKPADRRPPGVDWPPVESAIARGIGKTIDWFRRR